MSINRVDLDGGLVTPSEQVQSPGEGMGREPQGAESAEGSIPSDQVYLSGSFGTTYKELQLRKEQHNVVAGSIRDADRMADDLGQKIDALREPLEKIVKNFPPFAPEDRERVELLMSYSSIRKEINNLTVPPPPEVVKDRKAVKLPAALTEKADDRQIADHVSELDDAAASLEELRDELAAATASLQKEEGPGALFPARRGDEEVESSGVATESAAFEVSAEVGRQFANSVREGVAADDHTQFLRELS